MDAQKKSWLYRERDPQERSAFLEILALIPAASQVYVDQAGVEDTLEWAWGWSKKGLPCLAQRLGHRTGRVSMAAAWCCGEVIAPLTFEGYCHAELVEAWFEQQLCPALRPGQVVILDNASFHKMPVLAGLLEKVGCSLLPLPRYSPDLNKIEPLWNTLKIRIALDENLYPSFYPSFRFKVDAAFQ